MTLREKALKSLSIKAIAEAMTFAEQRLKRAKNPVKVRELMKEVREYRYIFWTSAYAGATDCDKSKKLKEA